MESCNTSNELPSTSKNHKPTISKCSIWISSVLNTIHFVSKAVMHGCSNIRISSVLNTIHSVSNAVMQGCSKTGGGKSHLDGAYVHFILSPKEVKTSAFFQISRNFCCLRITTSGSPVIASYWPLRVRKRINHISFTNSTAFCLTFWNTHLHLAFHNTQTRHCPLPNNRLL